MTTIVWNPKTGELGADRRVTWARGYTDMTCKIMQGKDFYLVAAGNIGPVLKILAEALGRLKLPNQPSEHMFMDEMSAAELLSFTDLFDGMVKDESITEISMAMFVDKGPGQHSIFELYSNGLMVETCPDRIIGMGTGADFAMGALAAGATTKRAIAIAARFCHTASAACDIVKPFKDWL